MVDSTELGTSTGEDSAVVDSADEGVGGVWEATGVVCEAPGPEGPTGREGLEPVSEGDEGLTPEGPVAVGLPGMVAGAVEVWT